MRATTFNSTSVELSVSITAQDIASVGTAQVTVVNPTPGGGISTAATFTINPQQNPLPTISSRFPPEHCCRYPARRWRPHDQRHEFPFELRSLVQREPAHDRLCKFDAAYGASARLRRCCQRDHQCDGFEPAARRGRFDTRPLSKWVPGARFALKANDAAAGLTEPFPVVVSLNAAGSAANGQSSASGHERRRPLCRILFRATDLVAKGNSGNIFLRDTCSVVANCTPQTIAVDLAADGSAPNAQPIAMWH